MFDGSLGGTETAQASVRSRGFARPRRVGNAPFGVILFGCLVSFSLIPSEASAQAPQPGCTSTIGTKYGPVFGQIISGVAGASNAITSVIGTVNTAFVAQGNAFAIGLPVAQPDEVAGGLWMRTIGGRVENQATGTFTGGVANIAGVSGSIQCDSDIRQDYAGFQLGQDLARLNIGGDGATLHVGITGGYAQSETQDLGGSNFNGDFQVPFAGAYATYTHGRFFADALLRGDFYQMNLNAAAASLGDQRLNAFGLTESTSAGYNIDVGNNWFVEPSVSGIHSTTKIDTLNLPGGAGNAFNPFPLPPGMVQFSNVESWLGRVGVRIGTNFVGGNVAWQPFATASVWHEFAGNTAAAYTAPELGNAFGTLSGSRVGTYGQYSVGVSGQMIGSPWLGYARIDFRDGENIEGVGFNAGLRYQFDSTQRIAAGAWSNGPVRPIAFDWSGFYIGGFSGAAWGKTQWNFAQIGSSADPTIAGVLGGVTVGYNKQFDRWVLGFEGDVAGTNASGGQSCQPGINDALSVQNCNENAHLLVTAAARVGYAWLDRVLLFVKAGGAWTNDALNVSCNGEAIYQWASGSGCATTNTDAPVQNMPISDPRFGATVGAGFELALTPAWSAKAEYDYLQFGSKNLVLSDTTPVSVRQSFDEVKIGFNYRFGVYDPDAATPAVANMPLKMAVKAPPPATAAAYNWTGAYGGLEAAYRFADASWNTTGLPGVLPAFPFQTVPDPTTSSAGFFNSSAQGGTFVGYDWQFARRWVTGIEADIDFGNSSMSRGGIPGTYGNGEASVTNPSPPPLVFQALPGTEAEGADSSTVRFGWNGSVRARLGYLSSPNVLAYATGGVAFQEVSIGASCNASFESFCDYTDVIARSETASTVKTGWTIGGGLEGVLTGNWLGKLDFRYADLGHYDHAFFAGTLSEVGMNVRLQTYTFLAGIGYKFNGTGNLIAQ
jgi:opacity protein-like surface antigen